MTIVRERGRVAGGVTIVRGRGGWLGVCDPIVRKEGGWGCDHSEGEGGVAEVCDPSEGERVGWGCDHSEGERQRMGWGCDHSEGEGEGVNLLIKPANQTC